MKIGWWWLWFVAPALWAADADNDGVPDEKDACPASPGWAVEANGCQRTPAHPLILHFDTDSARLRPEHYGLLAAFVDAGVEGRVMVVGHADHRGSEAHNQELAYQRSAAVSNALSKRYGVDPARIQRRSMGETLPWRDNQTETGQTLNRRVELWLETGLRVTNGEQ